MKRIITSAGLLAVGLSGLQAANDSFLTDLEKSKVWNVSGALRGFYDSNPTYMPHSQTTTGTWGMSVIPNVTFNLPRENTYVGFGVQYTLNYYAQEVFSKHYDQSVQAIAKLDHKFSDRFRLRFNDTFAYSNQPQILSDFGNPISSEANAIRNFAPITLNGQLTERIGMELGYQNNIINYFDSGAGSFRALLNRMEHLVHLDGRYNVTETFVTLLGYQFGAFDYNGNEMLYAPASVLTSDFRDFYSHYLYLGGELNLMKDLVIGLKAGAQYSNYDNANQTEWTPYVDLSGTYTYLPNSFVRLGFKSQVAATDVTGVQGTMPTLSQQLLLVYAMVTHQITPKLSGTLTGQFQNSTFVGANSLAEDENDNLYTFNAFLSYAFNRHLSTEVGYNYYGNVSDVTYTDRGFTRNLFYFGFRGTY